MKNAIHNTYNKFITILKDDNICSYPYQSESNYMDFPPIKPYQRVENMRTLTI